MIFLLMLVQILKEKRPFKTCLRKIVVNSFFINLAQESEIEKLTILDHVGFLLKSYKILLTF